jgi:hypothetical protein
VKRARQAATAAIVGAVASGCDPGDVGSLVREPTLAHFAWFLLLVPIGFVARIFIEYLVGEALGALLGRLLPPWLKTRRALWTGVAVMCVVTLAAVAYWNVAGRG